MMNILDKLFVEKTQNTTFQFFRSLIVASLSLVADFSILIFLTELMHLNYLISATISFIVGMSVNYFFSIKWVFFGSKLNERKKEVAVFAIIGIIGLLMTDISMWLLVTMFGLYYILSKTIIVLIVYTWNFGMRKHYLFA